MKNLQIGLEDNLVSYLDKVAQEQQKTRSAVIREAIRYWVRQSAVQEFEEQWIKALKSEDPEYKDHSDAWMAAEEWEDR